MTPLEHGIYRILLDTYYLDEKPLSLDVDHLMRTHSVRNADEVQAFEIILKEFFILQDDGFHHETCDTEIDKYKAKSEKAAASARARWDKTSDAMRTHTDRNANKEPRTKNQEPKDQKKKPPSFVIPENIDPDTWKAFIEHRVKLKAPMTDKAKTLLINKAEKIDGDNNDILNQSIENGWKGIFPLKEGFNNGTSKTNNSTSLGERATEARREFERQNPD